MNRLRITIICIILLLISTDIFATGYIRENNFMNEMDEEKRLEEIKRFQANYNLVVDGIIDSKTEEILYNDNIIVKDTVTNPPKGIWIAVDKTKKLLTVYNGAAVTHKFPVTLGKPGLGITPSGKAKINGKATNPSWGGLNGRFKPTPGGAIDNPLGSRWLSLYIPGVKDGYGIHGTIEPWEIGNYASYGCVRMFTPDIEDVIYKKANIGTQVWLGSTEELSNWGITQTTEKIEKVLVEDEVVDIQPSEDVFYADAVNATTLPKEINLIKEFLKDSTLLKLLLLRQITIPI